MMDDQSLKTLYFHNKELTSVIKISGKTTRQTPDHTAEKEEKTISQDIQLIKKTIYKVNATVGTFLSIKWFFARV